MHTDSLLQRWRTACILSAAPVIVIFCFGSALMANPSDRKPNAALAVHGTIPQAKALAERLYSIFNAAEPLRLEGYAAGTDYSKLPIGKLMSGSGEIWKAHRDANHLKLMGEPAGYEIERRLADQKKDYPGFAWRYGQTPNGLKIKAKMKIKLQKATPKIQKLAERAAKTLASGNLDAFETMMEKEGIQLKQDLSIFHPNEAPKFDFFFNLLARGDALIAKDRSEKYASVAEEAINKNLGIATAFDGLASGVVSQLRESGTFTSTDGNAADSVAAVWYLIREWEKASTALLRANAIHVAFGIDTDQSGAPDVIARMQTLNDRATTAIASTIAAASIHASSDQAAVLYLRLLEPVTLALRRRGPDAEDLITTCSSSLRDLAAKHPLLTEQINSYRKATQQSLHWRENFTTKQTAHLTNQYPSSAKFLADSEVPAVLNTWINRYMPTTAAQLLMKKVSDQSVTPLTVGGRLGVVAFQNQHYSLIALPLSVEEQLNALQASLLVTDENPPLSLEAVDAIASANRQEFLSVGGVIRNVSLEPLLVRFAALPDSAGAIAPLGTVPSLGDHKRPPLQAACWRLDIQPLWAQHRYFVAKASTD
ncbi:hypothetical protein [Rhodopirellula sp. SWK7]|uniref:hypothetical protein n=1 Tax=Rhodopirellula sp. SWK7 TaxID=595460 RepID=UPI0002BF90B7|nr:hypothetical protein [Rhodopirellula sp. SWK7]EMI45693.1 secreted protein [Rhodopirellula sp. SWK7]